LQVLLGGHKWARRSYGFDEVSVACGSVTVDPNDTDTSFAIGPHTFRIPFLASAMDGAVSPRICRIMGRLGGLAVLNLEGLFTRYENTDEQLERIISAPQEEVVSLLQTIYREPVKPELVARRVREIKEDGTLSAASVTPAAFDTVGRAALDAGLDILVIQSTVTSANHYSSQGVSLSIRDLCRDAGVPVVVGNVVNYEGALSLMEAGADAVLVGVGPGAACTTRRVCGIGVPQVTAVADAAAARDDFHSRTGKRVTVIADGGMRTGGDIVKAIVAGADAVMIGSPIAAAAEAPGRGWHWGMATSHPGLPRGTRIRVGEMGTLEQILFGPARSDDGTMNFVTALKVAMGYCGKRTIREMQTAEMVIAPAIPSEGKAHQRAQKVGQGT
jgi:IMP dehydrogenase